MSMNYKLIINLFRNIMDYLTEGSYDEIEDILSRPQLSDDVRNIFREYVTLITIKNQQIDTHMNDFIFFKNIIKKINNGVVVTVQDVMNQHEVNNEKRQVAAGLISKIQQIKDQSQIFGEKEQQMGHKQIQKMQDLQMENLKLQSLIDQIQQEVGEDKQKLKDQIEALTRQKKKMKAQVEELHSQLAKLALENERFKEQTQPKLKAQIAGLQELVKRLENEKADKSNEVQQTNVNLEQAVNQTSQIKEKYHETEEVLKIATRQNQDLHERLNQKEESLKIATHQTQELQERLNEREEYVKRVTQQSQDLHERLNEKEESLKIVQEQLKQYKLKNESSSLTLTQKQSIIKQQDSSILNLKSQIEENQIQKSQINGKSNISRLILSDEDNIVLYFIKFFNSNQVLTQNFFRKMQAEIGVIKKAQLLYKYSVHRRLKFHDMIDKKPNILLLCLTEDDRLIGGFTTAALSLKNQPQNTKSFLFNSTNDQINTYKLKPNKRSLQYDTDYILFGHEELCIEKNKLELRSFSVNGSTNKLHYQINIDQRATFLRAKDSKSKSKNTVALKDYQVLQVEF